MRWLDSRCLSCAFAICSRGGRQRLSGRRQRLWRTTAAEWRTTPAECSRRGGSVGTTARADSSAHLGFLLDTVEQHLQERQAATWDDVGGGTAGSQYSRLQRDARLRHRANADSAAVAGGRACRIAQQPQLSQLSSYKFFFFFKNLSVLNCWFTVNLTVWCHAARLLIDGRGSP